MYKKVCLIAIAILSISLEINIISVYNYVVKKNEYKESIIKFNEELTESCLLLCGEWEVTRYIGGGMSGFSRGDEPLELKAEERKRFSIFPDHVTVDEDTKYGKVYFLCRIIPKEWVYCFIYPWSFPGDADVELKDVGQDFYLLGNIYSCNEQVEELLPPIIRNNRIFIKDTDTIIIATIEGFYQVKRVKN